MRILKQKLQITDEWVYVLPGWKVKPIYVSEQRGELAMYFETDADDDDIIDDLSHCAKKTFDDRLHKRYRQHQ